MSCEAKHIAQLLNLDHCSKLFFEKGYRKHENWLQDCLVSFSPTGEVLIIAKGTNLIVYTSKWDSAVPGDVKMKYVPTWQGTPCNKSGEITSVLSLPLLSSSHSANGADWTCIIVGFSSGTVKFYTENMLQLLSEILHAEPVIQIKCNTCRASSHRGGNNLNEQELNEKIYVLYKSAICVLSGFSLFQTLQSCRNRLARQSAALQSINLDTSFPVYFKKYGFTDQDAISDASFIGQTSSNVFDHLVNASLAGGFNCNYRPSPPQTALIIATGRKPFLGFHFTVEGGGGAVLADFAVAVASKIKESVTANLPGWFGFGNSSEQEKVKVSQEPAEMLRCRFGLCDLWRHGNSIITSPDGKLSAVTDSLGRIILVENCSGITRRLWKGYREAQCGFLEVEEDIQRSRSRKSMSRSETGFTAPRRVLFIVIYAPKKGLIEIFAVQQGPCVASFKVSKHGRLIYTPYGLFGVNNNTPSKGGSASQFPVIFFAEDAILEIVVPFHCGLRSENSNKARDLHILKKMKVFLKEDHESELKFTDGMRSIAKDLKTYEIKMQVIEMLMFNKYITVPAFTAVLNTFMEGVETEGEWNQPRNFILLVESLQRLLEFYAFLSDLNSRPPNYKSVIGSKDSDNSLAETLLLTNQEMSSVLKLINTIREMERKKKDETKVSFLEKKTYLMQFLCCFDFNAFVNSTSCEEEKTKFSIFIKNDLESEKMVWLGQFFFRGIFYSDEWINDWKTHVVEMKLCMEGLMKCLIAYWMDKSLTENLTHEMTALVELMKAVCSLEDPDKISIEYSRSSPWWQTIRNYLKTNTCSVNTLLAAIACRTVTITVEQMKEIMHTQSGKKLVSGNEDDGHEAIEQLESSSSQNNEWESVSQDTCDWDILIVKLEDLAQLNSVLNLNISSSETSRRKLDFNARKLSLNEVLEKGNGYISELVAKWLAQFGLMPSCLIDVKDVEFQMKKAVPENAETGEVVTTEVEDTEEAKVLKENETVPIILDYVSLLKEKFPYSLTSSSLLGNVCWEYMAFWYRNVNDLDCLENAVDYLRHIPSLGLKHGLSYLCWTTYLVQKFETLAKLINKFGKVPNNKFCGNEVGLTNVQVTVFLRLCNEVLKTVLETEMAEKSDFITNQEGMWQNEQIGAAPSLATLALSQPKISGELLVLHYQLALILCMMAEFNIKFPKVVSSLFDNVAATKFFTDMTKVTQLSSHTGNVILTASRKQFLYKVIAGAVEKIEIMENIPPFCVTGTTDYVPETSLNLEKCKIWMSLCYDLARMWDVPLDNLRRQQVCELYSCGYDRLAEEILPSVNEVDTLASQLLVVAGKRLKIFIHSSSSLSKKLSVLSPNLSAWIESLDEKSMKTQNIVLNDLRTMVLYIIKLRPVKTDEEKLALAIEESLPSLENEDSFLS